MVRRFIVPTAHVSEGEAVSNEWQPSHSKMLISRLESGCFCPVVEMMKAADSRLGYDLARSDWSCLDHSMEWRVLLQANVRSVLMIIRQIFEPKPSQMTFIDRDDMIEHLRPNTFDPAFRDSVLPRAPNRCSRRSDAARIQETDDIMAKLRIIIE